MMQMEALAAVNFAVINPIIMNHNWTALDFTVLSKRLSGEDRYWSNNYVKIIEKIVKPSHLVPVTPSTNDK